MRKLPGAGNLLNIGLVLLFLTLAFVPSAKALFMRGLMDLGFFRADTSSQAEAREVLTSGVKFSDAAGKKVDLSELKGKVVFLNFWATWCPPCVAEMPAINKLHERFKRDDQVVFLLVDADSDLVKAKQFMNRKKYGLPVYKVASDVPEALFQGKLPTTVVFDKQGRVVYNESGAANYAHAKFISFIDTLKNAN